MQEDFCGKTWEEGGEKKGAERRNGRGRGKREEGRGGEGERERNKRRKEGEGRRALISV